MNHWLLDHGIGLINKELWLENITSSWSQPSAISQSDEARFEAYRKKTVTDDTISCVFLCVCVKYNLLYSEIRNYPAVNIFSEMTFSVHAIVAQ